MKFFLKIVIFLIATPGFYVLSEFISEKFNISIEQVMLYIIFMFIFEQATNKVLGIKLY
jgi:hypothetical protein